MKRSELSVLQMAGDCLFFPRFVRFVFVRNYCRGCVSLSLTSRRLEGEAETDVLWREDTEDTRRRGDEQPQQLRSYTWTRTSTG
jgi:hypothetical protein